MKYKKNITIWIFPKGAVTLDWGNVKPQAVGKSKIFNILFQE